MNFWKFFEKLVFNLNEKDVRWLRLVSPGFLFCDVRAGQQTGQIQFLSRHPALLYSDGGV